MASPEARRAAALDWAVRTGDPRFEDWESFTQWLEADPANAVAYDTVCAAVLDGTDLLGKAGAANDGAGHAEAYEAGTARTGRASVWLGAAAAATLAVLGTLAFWHGQRSDPYTLATQPGETRVVALNGGTTITLSGGTRITLDRKNVRHARLESGEAFFAVHHDASAPFEVETAQDRLVDIGTAFDVRVAGRALAVAVSEGAVQFNPDGADIRLDAGRQLVREEGSERLVVSDLPPERVGEWREGRVTFEQSSLSDVAVELSRVTGVHFVAAETSDAARVTGSILIAPIRQDPASLAELLGIKVIRSGEDWSLSAR